MTVREMVVASLLLGSVACTGPDPEVAQNSKPKSNPMVDANELTVTPPAPAADFSVGGVEVMESMPVQFAFPLTSTKHAGVKVVQCGKPDADGAIELQLQCDGRGESSGVRVALGALKAGSYRLKISLREGDTGEFKMTQSIELQAK